MLRVIFFNLVIGCPEGIEKQVMLIIDFNWQLIVEKHILPAYRKYQIFSIKQFKLLSRLLLIFFFQL